MRAIFVEKIGLIRPFRNYVGKNTVNCLVQIALLWYNIQVKVFVCTFADTNIIQKTACFYKETMKILPNPQQSENISGNFEIDSNTKIYSDSQFVEQAQRFADLVFACCEFRLQFTDVIEEAHIIFNFGEQFDKEEYVIMIAQGVATVTSSTNEGCFYAVESLRQIFNLDIPQTTVQCANCYVEDRPKYGYRGLLLDVCRHFFDVDTVKQIIDLMSQVKLNKLHLHLSDDQGFRVQIDKYPLLTEIGSVRYGTEVVQDGKRFVDECEYGGYYTKDDIAELVRYAEAHNVDIIPEIDVPGHFVAALAAYPQFSCTQQVAEVRKTWGISKDILCAGNDGSLAFVCDILDEICAMFPSQYVHLGGDEAPKDRWCNCKLCREKMADLKLNDYDELQTYFVEQLRKYLEQKGKTVICFNDGITGSTSDAVISQVWKPASRRRSARQANQGRKIILSPYFSCYFDMPYALVPLNKTLWLNPTKGVHISAQDNIMGVEGCMWTEYVADRDKLFFNLLPRLDALAECAWGHPKNNFNKRVKRRFALYDRLNLRYNAKALNPTVWGRVSTIKRFFRKDANVELNADKKTKE